MVVIIDGYNLLKNIFAHQKDNLGKQRDYLVQQLGSYKHSKGDAITDIVLVFDGGLIDKASREVRHGVVVIYAGRGKSADRWIEKFVERNRHRSILLVSNDRQLVSRCRNRGAEPMKIDEFYSIVQNAVVQAQSVSPESSIAHCVQKFESESHELDSQSAFDQRAVDMLMEQASLQNIDKRIEDDGQPDRRSASQVLSKEEKRKQAKIKKLL